MPIHQKFDLTSHEAHAIIHSLCHMETVDNITKDLVFICITWKMSHPILGWKLKDKFEQVCLLKKSRLWRTYITQMPELNWRDILTVGEARGFAR